MKTLATILMCAGMALAASGAYAQDAMKPGDAMAEDGMMKRAMTEQDCKDHIAMAKHDGMKKDDAMMKKDALCADMVKPHDAMMKKDGMSGEPMKK